MAKGPRRSRRDRAELLREDARGPSAKQVARELAKLEKRLAQARVVQSKRHRQLEEGAADVASLASDVARLHAALTAIEVASAPDIASLVDGLDEELARLDNADELGPVRRWRRVEPVQPVETAGIAEEPVAADIEGAAEATALTEIVEEETFLVTPTAVTAEAVPALPADVGELDALADIAQPETIAADHTEAGEADEPGGADAPDEPDMSVDESQPAADDWWVAAEPAPSEDALASAPVVTDDAPVDETDLPAEGPEAPEELEVPARAAPPARTAPATPRRPEPGEGWNAGRGLPFRPSRATVEDAVFAGVVAPSTNGSGLAAIRTLPDDTLDPTEEVHVAASIDVGSNSIHLLAAVVADHELRPLVDESALLGLGSVVDERGYMSHRRADSLAAIRAYIEEARDLHAADVTVVGTEPMRRAADSTRLIVELENATGTPIHVVDHVEEALLTLIGVTGGRPVETDLGVVDVGGGSSEIVLVSPGRPPVAGGLRVGSARLTTAIVRHDPPTLAEIEQLRAEARHRMASAPLGSPELLIAVGGTATNLLRVLPGTALDRTLTRRRLAEAMDVLATEPAEEAARRHAVSLMRARILPAGAAIMEALLERYALDQLYVSDAGIREGTILAVAHSGPNWRDQLPLLAQGWRH